MWGKRGATYGEKGVCRRITSHAGSVSVAIGGARPSCRSSRAPRWSEMAPRHWPRSVRASSGSASHQQPMRSRHSSCQARSSLIGASADPSTAPPAAPSAPASATSSSRRPLLGRCVPLSRHASGSAVPTAAVAAAAAAAPRELLFTPARPARAPPSARAPAAPSARFRPRGRVARFVGCQTIPASSSRSFLLGTSVPCLCASRCAATHEPRRKPSGDTNA